MIDYQKRLTTHREFYPIKELDYSVESDRGRILSSSGMRRLQKRTQVFALELNASIRTRLTHSLEVAQTARFIGKSILAKLKEEGLETYRLDGLENAFVSTSEMTSLLHDIGNPPFGHFAEQTINKWIEEHLYKIWHAFPATDEASLELKHILWQDLCNYDGNAQAIRLITKLQRLNLSYMQILSVLKYTRGAFESPPAEGEPLSYIRKKPGYFYSEKEQIETMWQILGVIPGHRFPITYIMEAADDISYLTADLEDSVEKGILTLDEVYTLITQACQKQGETYLLEVVRKQYEKAKKDQEPYQFNMFFTLTRANLVTALVKYVVEIYLANHEAIFEGSFDAPLLEYDKESTYYKAIKILQEVSRRHIYRHKEVQTLEMQGYTIINGLFNIYKPLLELDVSDIEALLAEKKIDCFISMRLIRRISPKQIVAYKNSVEAIKKQDEASFRLLEWYYRVRLIVDYISGMTDDYALHEYQTLTAMK